MNESVSLDVRLLTATYRMEGDELVVELYGKSRDGRSAVIRFKGFKPYFVVLGNFEETKRLIEGETELVSIQRRKYLLGSSEREGAVITIRSPWKVPELRSRFRVNRELVVVAADIPFAHRFIYDMDIGACCSVSGDDVTTSYRNRYAVDVVIDAHSFRETEDFKPPLKILSFDIESSIKKSNIWCICIAYRTGEEIKHERFYGDEASLIRQFFRRLEELDPDVITGYNIDGFDIPKINERCEALKIGSMPWGRDRESIRSVSNRFWRCNGRIIADAWWHMKRYFHPKQETLNAVAKELLNEEKLDVDRLKIDEEWARDNDRVMDYCELDAELALKILEKTRVLARAMDMATVSKLPLDDTLNGGASQLVDSLLIRAADRAGAATPMGGRSSENEEVPAVEGGYVHSISPGLYHWVGVLDFKSMYPSLIIAKNICFTTLSDQGEIVSPTGARFLSPSVRKGIIPALLTELMEERDSIKNRMKNTTDKAEYEYLDGLQQAVKILMNSFYGVLASSFYRFTNYAIGGSITAFARETTKGVIQQLEGEGIPVIYSDTDSVFFKSPYENLEETIAFGERLSERFSSKGVTLEFEEVFEPLFSHGKKKRYVGRLVWPEKGLVVRGYEIRRTDSFDYQSESLSLVFEEILSGNTEGAVTLSRKLVGDVLQGKVPKEKLVISRTCRNFSEYKDSETQVTVQAAKKLISAGEEFIPGMKVSWIVVNSRKSPQQVEPYISGREFTHTPDYAYYAGRVAQTLSRVTEIFGINEENLVTGSRQSTLFDDVKTERKIAGSKTDRKMRLEDFL